MKQGKKLNVGPCRTFVIAVRPGGTWYVKLKIVKPEAKKNKKKHLVGMLQENRKRSCIGLHDCSAQDIMASVASGDQTSWS